jgi:hypothetical protein
LGLAALPWSAAVALAATSVPADGPASWLLTGVMREPSVEHTATLLADGRVLVCGGRRSGGGPARFAGCEIWNPETERWAPAGTLARPRERPAAVQLADGRVVFLGSAGAAQNTPNAVDIWDPRRNDTVAAGSLPLPAENLLAARLLDGRVLAVADGPKFEKTQAAIWNPADQKSSPVDAPTDAGRTLALRVDARGTITLVRSRSGCHEIAIWRRRAGEAWALAHVDTVPVCAVGALALDDQQIVYWSARLGIGAPYATLWDASSGESRTLDIPEPVHFQELIAAGEGRAMVVGSDGSFLYVPERGWRPSGAVERFAESTFTPLADGRVLMVGPLRVRVWTPADFSNGRPCAGPTAFFEAVATRDGDMIPVDRPTPYNVGSACQAVIAADPNSDAGVALKALALRPEKERGRVGVEALCELGPAWAADVMIRGLDPSMTDDRVGACLAAVAESDQPVAREAVDRYLQACARAERSFYPLIPAARSSERLRARMGVVLVAYWKAHWHGFDQLRQVACMSPAPLPALEVCERTTEHEERDWVVDQRERSAERWRHARLYLSIGAAAAVGAGLAVSGTATRHSDLGRGIAITSGALGGGALLMASFIDIDHGGQPGLEFGDGLRRLAAVTGGVVGLTGAALATGSSSGKSRAAISILGGSIFSVVSVTAIWHFRDF